MSYALNSGVRLSLLTRLYDIRIHIDGEVHDDYFANHIRSKIYY